MNALKEFFENHKSAIIGGFVGLVIAILFLTIGFFATLLIVVLVLLGAVLGKQEFRLKVKAFFIAGYRRIFKGK